MKKMRLSVVNVARSVFPVLRWSQGYSVETGVCDLVAGVTVALTLVPQSIAYASLAGFEPQYGLYASFAGSFVYALLGTVPQINIGPTALLSLLTFSYTSGTNTDLAILLCFLGGLLQLLAGVARLGFLVDLVSVPVVSGFTSAAAVTIASSQIKSLLGLKFSAESFVATWREVFRHIAETRLADALLSAACCCLLFAMKAVKDIKVKGNEEKDNKKAKTIKQTLWFVGVSRNAAVVVLAALVAFFTFSDGRSPFKLTGEITRGLPTPQLPAFETRVGNVTLSALDMVRHLGSGLLVVPLVGVIANVAIAKAFANGKTLEATQEIVALGLCNVVGAFFRSFPVNGSFTRSAVSHASGVRTPAAGLYTGVIVILTLVLLTPYFFYIPRAALASVIVCAVLHMVDLAIVRKLWNTNRLDLIPLLGTVLACLALGIEVGLGCGVAIDVLLLLFYQSRPPLHLSLVKEGTASAHYAARPTGGLHFAGADRVRAQLTALPAPPRERGAVRLAHSATPLVLYCDALARIDYTSLQSMKSLIDDCAAQHRKVIFFGVQPQVLAQLETVLQDQLLACSSQRDLDLVLADLSAASAAVEALEQVRLEGGGDGGGGGGGGGPRSKVLDDTPL